MGFAHNPTGSYRSSLFSSKTTSPRTPFSEILSPPHTCTQWRRQDFVTGGELRYGSIGGLEYEVPQSRLYCLCINVALLDGLSMYLSCDTKKFHDN